MSLDRAGCSSPFVAVLELGDKVINKELRVATTSAIQLIGNANARISRLRHEKFVGASNKSLLPMIKEDGPYVGICPDLFEPDFAKKSKDLKSRPYTLC